MKQLINKAMEKHFAFHQWPVSDTEQYFKVDTNQGLSEEKAKTRLAEGGKNTLENLKETSPFEIFFRQFANFFIILLFAAALISYFVDGPLQAVVLLVVIGINVGLGFFQEYKAQRSLSELKKSFVSKSKVMRDGKVRIVDSQDLVMGDIVIVESGDKVPADLRLVYEESLRTTEASLTGESVPVNKNTKPLPIDTPLGDRKNMLFGSTIVVAGHGRGIVVATGTNTEFGQIAQLVEGEQEEAPLERQIRYLGKNLTFIALGLAVFIFVLGYFRQYPIWELLTFTIALLVAVVPESLPTVITLSLAIGVSRMAKQKAVTRRMAVVETLGAINIIATDKTGTLTDNNLVAEKIYLYKKGEFEEVPVTDKNKDHKSAIDFFAHGIACSNVDLKNKEDLVGDPLEIAVVEGADLLDKLAAFKAKKLKRLLEIPFDSDKKFMAVLLEEANGQKSLIAKGATEKIVEFCQLKNSEKTKILAQSELLSSLGYKVIALSDKHLGQLSSSILKGMEFVGLFALVDQPSPGIKEAIAATLAAGIRPIILTGDHPETAKYIASKIGLNIAADEIITEKEFSSLSANELKKALRRVKIFARVTPADKIKIVLELQKLGFCVAMTGDGVNDAPALKKADAGIAMGIKGTDAAKEAADIVLLDDKYGTIVRAIEYGRTISDNIKNAVVFLIASNMIELSLVGISFLFGLPLPFTTLQILWINLITDSFPAIALAFEQPNKKVLSEPPRSAKSDSLRGAIFYSLYLALASVLIGLSLYLWGLSRSVSHAQTLAFTYVVLLGLVYAFSIRSKKRIWQGLSSFLENKFMIIGLCASLILQLLIFLPVIRPIFRIEALTLVEGLTLALAMVFTFIIAEWVRSLIDLKQKKLQS